MTLLDPPIASASALRRASANFIANCSALAGSQLDLSQSLLPPREEVEFVFGRDGTLTAIHEDGGWWSGCSLPAAAGSAMLKSMDLNAAVSCFLAPPHAAHLHVALDKLKSEQAIIAVVPEESDLRLIFTCGDFSQDIAAHRLWIAAGLSWAEQLESLLMQQIGLAVPAQFLRLHASDDTLIQKLIQAATAVFSRITHERANIVSQLSANYVEPVEPRFCIMTPQLFRLWNDEGRVLSEIAPDDSIKLDTSDPSLSSPLKLATTASECGALLAPNFARADLPGAIPVNVPWFTWVTNDRVPSFELAGPRDQLLIAAPSVRAAALAAGWPADRAHPGAWPAQRLPAAKGKPVLTVLADTMLVATPADLEKFSSHRVLWETIQSELLNNPLVVESDPGAFLISRMRRFDVSADGFPYDRFLTHLIVPAYQQSVVRQLLGAGLPLQLHGEGWGEIEEFKSYAAGAVHSQAEATRILEGATALVDLWPWRAGHPISGVDRPIFRCEGRNFAILVQRARNVLSGRAATALPLSTRISSELLIGLLQTS